MMMRDDFFITKEYIKNIPNDHFTYNIEWCSNYTEALSQICNGKYDIYFVDYYMGANTGLDLIKEAISRNCEEPIILLTGNGNHAIDILAMEAGAVDYLIKSDLNTEKIERCIRYALGRYEFIKVLRINEQKFRNFFEKSMDSVFIADEDLIFKDINPSTTTLTGYSREELLELSLYDLFADKNDRQLIEQELKEFGEVVDKEMELLTNEKEKINCIVSVSGEKDIKGNFYIQGIIHDITTLKKSEKATLQAEKLKAAQRLLRTLAHEVRNPLNNIFLSLEELDSRFAENDSRDLFDIIVRNSKRINSLITELLDSARPSEMALQKIPLQILLEESINAALDRITLKRITLKLDYVKEDAWVMADPAKIKIAFLNIIINAIEAMEGEDSQLLIELQSDHTEYIVSITDNGSGISDENLGTLFEPYYTSKNNGMGLGLSSTLNILQSHKASIEVKTKLTEGTTFIITFPKINSSL